MLISLHSPYIEPGDLKNNLSSHLELIRKSNSDFHIFPELSLTGYNCGDLFFNILDISLAKFKGSSKCSKTSLFITRSNELSLKGSLHASASINFILFST